MDKIREGIAKILLDSWEVDRMQIHDNYDLDEEKAAKRIVEYLHSQGVVRKVDRELPDRCDDRLQNNSDFEEGYIISQKDMLKAGYVAVEPLIGGGDG